MIQNTVQTLVNYAKDLSGQTNATTDKVIRALNFGTDHLSVLKLMASSRFNPDSSNHDDLPRTVVTTSDATLAVSGGSLDAGELQTLRALEILIGSEYKRLTSIDTRDAGYENVQGQSGTPEFFDADGTIIRLYPIPNAAYTYRATYGRVHPRYSASNLTQSTGLLPNEEEYVALYAADRLMIGGNDPSRTQIRNELTVKAEEIKKMSALRDQTTPRRMKPMANSISINAFNRR